MSLSGDDRAVVVQVGAVLMFGFIVMAITMYQVQVVPDQNHEIEFKHNQRVQDELIELRSAIVTTAGGGGTRSTSVTLGTSYPSRTIFVNPPPPYGRLRTVGTENETIAIRIENARAANAETADRWNGTTQSFSTGSIVYEPFYHRYDAAPVTVYDNAVLVNRFEDETLAKTNQSIVDGDEITLVALDGSLSEAGVESESIDTKALSVSHETIQVDNPGGDLTIRVPTQLENETWAALLNSEVAPRGNVSDFEVESSPDGPNTLVIEFAPGTYTLKLAKVGIGSETDPPAASSHFLTTSDGTDQTIPTGGSVELTVQVRDRFNNPVAGERVRVNTTGNVTQTDARTNADGELAVQFNASDSPGVHTVTATIDDNETAAKRVRFDVTVAPASGAGNGVYAIEWHHPDEDNEDRVLSECSPERCTWDVSQDVDARLDLRAVIDEGLGGLGVEFGVSDRGVAIVQPDEAETDANGAVTTDLIAQSNGTVDLFASSGGASDRLTIHVTNVTDGGGGLNEGPTARFDVSPSDPDAGDVVTVDASTSNDPDGSIASYEWDFDDGSTATGETASHAYASTGTYTVTLEVTDDVGATDTATEVVVINQAPTAAYTYSPSSPTTADSIRFDASGSSDSDGSIISYEWDFGDGTLTTGQTAFHSYEQDGTYTVALTVIDTSGSTDTVAKTVQVGNQAPVADFAVSPSPPNAGEPVTLDGTPSDDPDGSIASYQWDLGDGTTAIGPTPTHTYDTAGNYTVALTVIDDDGATNTVSETVQIATEQPTASFDYSPIGAATDEPVTFDASGSSDPDGSIAGYEWAFEDGATATGEVVQHSFEDDGPYSVELTVTDDEGGTDSIVKTVRIDNRPPDPDFSYSPGDAGADESITFDGTASSDPDGSVSTYEWDWDADGTYEASGATAIHAFADSGLHDVGLRVTDDDGKTDTVTKAVRVVGWEYNGDAIARDGQDDPTPDRPGGVEFSLTNQFGQEANITAIGINVTEPETYYLIETEWQGDEPEIAEVYFEGDVSDGYMDFAGWTELPDTFDVDSDGDNAHNGEPVVSSDGTVTIYLYEFQTEPEPWTLENADVSGTTIEVTIHYRLADGTTGQTTVTITP